MYQLKTVSTLESDFPRSPLLFTYPQLIVLFFSLSVTLVGRGPGDEDGDEEELPDFGRHGAVHELEGGGQQELRGGETGPQGHGVAVLGGTEAQAGGGLKEKDSRNSKCDMFANCCKCHCQLFPFVVYIFAVIELVIG